MTELVRHVLDEIPTRDALMAEPTLVTHLLVGHADFRLSVYGTDRWTADHLFRNAVPG